MKKKFEDSYSYKLIYIFRINDEAHKGLLKIGDATLKTSESVDRLPPNCRPLNLAARERIDSYTKTAGVEYDLLHTELAVRTDIKKGTVTAFRDHDVHNVLTNSGIEKFVFKKSKAKEWFKIDLGTAIRAIEAVKKFKPSLNPSEKGIVCTPPVLRPEQLDAVDKTIKIFRHENKMLWNAKMRFGKTLSALEVVRRMGFEKTIIFTHRPAVDKGWFEDFDKIFYGADDIIYSSKYKGCSLEQLLKSGQRFIYFTSIQDLGGSEQVGGKYPKNHLIYNTNWDCVIVDEAHEGTTTPRGENIIDTIVKENTKFLALSGTPFNILGNYGNNVYTWDYIMEQQYKAKWDVENFGDSNPYDELPQMNIYVYDLGKLLGNKYVELEDKAFNFKEFFRVWTGDIRRDFRPLPSGAKVGDFVHEEDVRSFLNLITAEDSESQYPYSTKEYRDMFKHTLWKIPGVKEAKALKRLMKQHPVFSFFDVVNIAGDGDEEEKSDDALKKVETAINDAGEDGYTITLSCGKLTTGVTVREWNAVFMLSGSFSTSAASYLQTIFRAQSPCNKFGKIKDKCYVFDFAPDRTLKMVAESVALSTKAGKATESDRKILGEFLNYCPVISIEGTSMHKYETNRLLQQLKRAYADRAVSNGFDDNNLYNDELLKLSDIDLEKFNELNKIIGKSNAQPKQNKVTLNNQGFTDEKYEELGKLEKKPKRERTKEEEERLKELQEKKKSRQTAISILRGVSIRMPLLIYGADIPIDEDFTLDKLLDENVVDEASWTEFMPKGVTREVFKGFMKYYDQDIFVAAGRKIRNTVKGADELPPTERTMQIAGLFACFKNPDKETVLTPWRVVNMHMSDCLGGYSFYEDNPPVDAQMLSEPRFVDRGEITKETFSNTKAHILEINSKTGLYPLYVVYSIFRKRCAAYGEDELTLDKQNELWLQTVRENIFVICMTPMAERITRRTLVGYKKAAVNTHHFDDLINMLKHKSKQFTDKVLKASYWKQEGDKMTFDAVVGNPPYQIMDGGAQSSAKPLYQYFVAIGEDLTDKYVSLIMPARWYSGGKGLDEFRDEMLNDTRIICFHDFLNPEQVFPNTNIRGGLCYFVWNKVCKNLSDLTEVYTHDGSNVYSVSRTLKTENCDVFIRHSMAISILNKVQQIAESYIESLVSPRKPFGIESNIISSDDFHVNEDGLDKPIKCYGKAKISGFVEEEMIKSHHEWIGCYKVFIPRANNIGTELNDDNLNSFVGEPNTICTESYIAVGAEDNLNKNSASNMALYLHTKFARFMHSLAKSSQDSTSKTFKFVPVQDFTASSDIDWTKPVPEIDKQLYAKYGLDEGEIAFIESMIKPME